MLSGLAIRPKLMKEGRLAIVLSLERSYCIEIEEHGSFARLTCHPNIGFVPNKCPEKVLAHLLLRNGDAGCGGWRLMVADERVWIVYSYSIPIQFLTRKSLRAGIELVLTEANRFSFEYRYFARA